MRISPAPAFSLSFISVGGPPSLHAVGSKLVSAADLKTLSRGFPKRAAEVWQRKLPRAHTHFRQSGIDIRHTAGKSMGGEQVKKFRNGGNSPL